MVKYVKPIWACERCGCRFPIFRVRLLSWNVGEYVKGLGVGFHLLELVQFSW